MLNKVTHGTSRASIIFLATVVLPEALPPQTPMMSTDREQHQQKLLKITRTYNEAFLRLTLSVIPRWSTSSINGSLCSSQNRLSLGGIFGKGKSTLAFCFERVDVFRREYRG